MPKNLLLADDSITIQKVVGITFAQEDYDITYTDNGEDAVNKAKEIKPDIVLADIIMPQKNGYEVCETIKKDPELNTTPVLLLAGTFETFDENRGKQVGADGYIIKPFESQALIDKVNELVGKKSGPSIEVLKSPAVPAATPSPVPTPPPSPEPASDGMFKPEVPPKPVDTPDLTPPPIPDTPPLEEPTIDKRMEPMLEVDKPSFAETEVPANEPAKAFVAPEPPKMPEPPKVEQPTPEPPAQDFSAPQTPDLEPVAEPDQDSSPLGEIDILAEPGAETPNIDLASPADFIMNATSENQPDAITPEPEGKKEDFVEVEKPPTFDFVSGESDLRPDSQSQDSKNDPFPPAPDFSAPQAPDLGSNESQEDKMVTQPPSEIPESQPQTDDLITLPPVDPSAPPLETAEPSPIVEPPKPESAQPSQTPDLAPQPDQPTAKIPEEQMEELVTKVSQAVIEKIAWEVVPDLAERIIKAEIKRLTEEKK